MLPPSRVTVGKNVGLHVSWYVYRGPVGGKATADRLRHGLGLLLDESEGRKLGLVGADVNWVNEINKVWLTTEVLEQMLLIAD